MKKRILFFVLMAVVGLSVCSCKSDEQKKETEAARVKFASLVHGDLVEVKSGHVLYVTEIMGMSDNFVHAVPCVGVGKNDYMYDPPSLNRCLVRIVKKGDADYDKVLLAFAKQGIWYSLK